MAMTAVGGGIMEKLSNKVLAAQVAVTGYIAGAFERARDERGQGSIEYAGIIVVVVAIIAIIVGFATPIGGAIAGKITEAVNSFTVGG
jgi:Flp pilus assembly pilin Flp